jgi:glycosyltransferase involved in cell wall biosynthesis
VNDIIPKYSIIIPTRNGLKYLQFSIQSVLLQPENNFELIISDNHSKDGTKEYLDSITDSRLRIIRPPAEVSMSNHFEFALNQAKGEWISLLGDDDGLQPYFFQLAENLTSQYSMYEVICSARSYYFWKGCENIYGKTVVSFNANSKIEIRNSYQQFKKLLFKETLYFDEPQFYTGTIFKKKLLDKIRLKQNGRILNSITPDANSAALILKHTKKYLFTYTPLSWVGSSPKSTGFNGSKDLTSDDKNVSSEQVKDFIKLNNKDEIVINSRFKDIIALFDIQCFFLEAFVQSNLLYRPFPFVIYDFLPIRYFTFIKIYKNYNNRLKTQPHLKAYYYQLFNDNKLYIPLLRLLYLINEKRNRNKILKKINHLLDRINHKISPKEIIHEKYEEGSFYSESHEEYPTIINAGKASLSVFKKMSHNP